MMESVAYVHTKGVRHANIRLEQDDNVLLSDFNASGFDDQPGLSLNAKLAQGLESSSHYLPRDPNLDSTAKF